MIGLVFRPWAKNCPLFERCFVAMSWLKSLYIHWLTRVPKQTTHLLLTTWKQSFFTSLKISITTFGIRRAYICLRICLTRLFLFVITGCCPNYFLHESNLFLKKNNYWEEISCCIGTTIRVLCALHILFIIFSTWSGEGR